MMQFAFWRMRLFMPVHFAKLNYDPLMLERLLKKMGVYDPLLTPPYPPWYEYDPGSTRVEDLFVLLGMA